MNKIIKKDINAQCSIVNAQLSIKSSKDVVNVKFFKGGNSGI